MTFSAVACANTNFWFLMCKLCRRRLRYAEHERRMSAFGPKRTCRKTQSMSLLGVKQTRLFVPQVCLRPKVDCNGNNHQFLVSKKQETLEVVCQFNTLITIADAGRGNYFSQKHRWHGTSTISISQYIKTPVRPTDQRGI